MKMMYVQKKKPLTLASRIFTIQFGDAISFAVHTVYEQDCMSISSVRCGQIRRGKKKNNNNNNKIRGCFIHLNFVRINR